MASGGRESAELPARSTLDATDNTSNSGRATVALLGICAIVGAAVAVVATSGSPIGAQTPAPVIRPVSIDATGTAPIGTFAGHPAVSDAGAVVAFDSADLPNGSDRGVWIRDRVAATSTPVAERPSATPGISGDGCLVAYTVPAGNGAKATTSLVAVDRCSTPSGDALAAGTLIDTIAAAVAESAPALSVDGSTIAWSTGSEIRRYERPTPSDPHALVDTFDADLVVSVDSVTGSDVDVSDDGTTVVFLAGPGGVVTAPEPSNVYVWSAGAVGGTGSPTLVAVSLTATGALGAQPSGSPTVSGDGSLVFFESTSTDLMAVGGQPVVGPFVVYVDLIGRGTRVLVDDARRPAVSGDGLHVAYERAGAIRVASSATPTYATTQDLPVGGLETANPLTGAMLSRHGRWIVFDSGDGASLTADVAFHDGIGVWTADRRPADDGSVLDTTTTTTPDGSTSTTTATTTATPNSTTTTTATTTTTVDEPDGPPVAVLPPATTLPRFRAPTSSFPTRTTTRSSGSGSTTFSSSSVGAVPLVQSKPVVFEPTVVGAGRRTAAASLVNAGTFAATVTSVRIDTSGDFQVVADNCSGQTVQAGSSCTVDIRFAPLVVGPASGVLTFDFSDGASATASLAGEGAAEPTLDAVPAVAAPGQVVTLFGAGFPAGSSVQLTRSTISETVTVDAEGTFVHVFVVLPNTPSGPMVLTVAAQPDQFNDVTADLLVSNRSSDSNSAAFRSSATR